MSRYNGNYALPSSAKSATSFDTSLKIERHDDRASQSGSEDGSYAHFGGDPLKIEGELEDESNMALTSQTLNADGTPKRPMNAFMIFARRRRPQVSAENQAMRTGEISKILSKEWVSMPQSDKQFYLEQAKQLKETFNTRYPDYVYRRRPNNSRKRRRSDAGTRSTDQALIDQGDDMSGSVDLEASPTDADDHVEASLPSPYSRPSYISQSSIDQAKYGSHSRPGHQVSSDPGFRSNGEFSTSVSERMGPLDPATSPRLSIGHSGMAYPPYGQSQQNHNQAPTIFGTQSVPSHQGWQTRVDRTAPSWLGGSQDRIPSSISSHRNSPFSSSNAWNNSSENSSAPPSASPTSQNFFPTLNTPFYPNQPHLSQFQSNASNSSSNSVPPQNPGSYEPLGHLQSNPMSREYTPRSYESSSISPLQNSYSNAPSRDPLSTYSQRHLPPVQTGLGYPPPPSGQGHGHSPTYWPRD